jgi:cytochrome P450
MQQRRADFPIGETITLDGLSRDPYPLFHVLRAREPVTWAPALGQWLVTRRDDVLAILRDPDVFRTDSDRSPIRDSFGAQMLSTEGEAQRRYKSGCASPFNSRAVEDGAAPFVRETVVRLVRQLQRQPGAELRREFAAPLALATVAHILGLPSGLEAQLRDWYDTFADALVNFDGDPSMRTRAHRSASAFRQAIAPSLRSPSAAETSLLAHLARQEPRTLSDEEIGSNALIVLFGGIETTEAAIANALWALLTHGEAMSQARSSGDALAACVEESMRWESAVQTCSRYAVSGVEVRGAAIAEGELVQCMLGAANRDPAVYADPDRFDPWRTERGPHLAFGSGRHFCLGAALARLEARVAAAALLDAFPDLRLERDRSEGPRGHEFRKPPSLHVSWRS